MNENIESDAKFFRSIRWPMIAGALLLGHFMLMIVALCLALGDPESIAPVPKTATPGQSPAPNHASYGVDQ